MLRTAIIACSGLVLGALLGPLAFAALSSATAKEDREHAAFEEAVKLSDRYIEAQPRLQLYLSLMSPDILYDHCGHDFDQLFPDIMDDLEALHAIGRYSDYEGFEAIDELRRRNGLEVRRTGLAMELEDRLSHFELGFLRRCIDATMFSGLCMQKVADIDTDLSDDAEVFSRVFIPGAGEEPQIICTYLDGVAARRNLPLPENDARGNAD